MLPASPTDAFQSTQATEQKTTGEDGDPALLKDPDSQPLNETVPGQPPGDTKCGARRGVCRTTRQPDTMPPGPRVLPGVLEQGTGVFKRTVSVSAGHFTLRNERLGGFHRLQREFLSRRDSPTLVAATGPHVLCRGPTGLLVETENGGATGQLLAAACATPTVALATASHTATPGLNLREKSNPPARQGSKYLDKNVIHQSRPDKELTELRLPNPARSSQRGARFQPRPSVFIFNYASSSLHLNCSKVLRLFVCLFFNSPKNCGPPGEEGFKTGSGTETLRCWWEGKTVQPLWKTVRPFCAKLNTLSPHDPGATLLGMSPVELRI